jgi:hypothetical protein
MFATIIQGADNLITATITVLPIARFNLCGDFDRIISLSGGTAFLFRGRF